MRGAHSRFAALAAAQVVACVLHAAENDVLYWMVNSSATVQNGGETLWLSDYLGTYGADSSFAARIRVTGGSISGDTFLGIYYYDEEQGALTLDPGNWGIGFDTEADVSSVYWGAGVPDGNQSPSGEFSQGEPEYSFIVEIGNVAFDSEDNPVSWTTVATSAATAYSSLGDFIHPTFSIDPSSLAAWTPTDFVSAPEPSSGLLTLMGMALMALRRRRCMNG